MSDFELMEEIDRFMGNNTAFLLQKDP